MSMGWMNNKSEQEHEYYESEPVYNSAGIKVGAIIVRKEDSE
tara:strand:+ start:15366 stop:15491 length:126 start_codon:yes stop_codon:yes gene_type:complete